jgi:hypothetical protein
MTIGGKEEGFGEKEMSVEEWKWNFGGERRDGWKGNRNWAESLRRWRG